MDRLGTTFLFRRQFGEFAILLPVVGVQASDGLQKSIFDGHALSRTNLFEHFSKFLFVLDLRLSLPLFQEQNQLFGFGDVFTNGSDVFSLLLIMSLEDFYLMNEKKLTDHAKKDKFGLTQVLNGPTSLITSPDAL